MSSILKPACPYCRNPVPIFGKGWQDQRAATKKTCPSCHGAVKATFAGKAFLVWLVPFLAAAAVAFYLKEFRAGAWLFTAAFLVPLIASVQLERDAG